MPLFPGAGAPAHLTVTTDQPVELVVERPAGRRIFPLTPGTHSLVAE